MSEASKHNAFAQNIVLMALETGFSWLMQHDALLKEQVQPLIKKNTVVKINNFIPVFNVYIQFTEQGVLFDLDEPQKKPDLKMRATPVVLFKILVMGDTRSLRNLRIEGDVDLAYQFKDLLLLCTLSKIITDLPKWLFTAPEKQLFSQSRIAPLLETLAQQREYISKLKSELKRDEYQHKKLVKQAKLFKTCTMVFAFLFISCLVLLIFKW